MYLAVGRALPALCGGSYEDGEQVHVVAIGFRSEVCIPADHTSVFHQGLDQKSCRVGLCMR